MPLPLNVANFDQQQERTIRHYDDGLTPTDGQP